MCERPFDIVEEMKDKMLKGNDIMDGGAKSIIES